MKKDKIFSNIRRFFTNRFVALGALSLAVAVVIASSFWWGLQVGKRTPQIVKVEGVNVAAPTGTTADFGPFWQTWKLISDIYLKNSSTSDQDKVRGATKGLVEALGDPYSQFFSPDDSKKFQEDIQGNFSGVGMQLGMDKDQIVVVSPLKDTPASRAGIRSGDRIMKINSSSTQGMALDEAVNLIRGPVNTNVEISILRDQWEQPKALTLTRDGCVMQVHTFRWG
jgi:carboxyl-terminal processing protease